MYVPARRTLIVLASLVGAMTIASALLLALEPRPSMPTNEPIKLIGVGGAPDPASILFDTTTPITRNRWSKIVVHFSGSMRGSATTLNLAHTRLGIDGLGYHFVIDNGQGGPDGQIEIGFRWRRQLIGAHSVGPNSEEINKQAIGICLIGDSDHAAPSDAQIRELAWLVRQLQQRFEIPAHQVVVQSADPRGGSGRYFPEATFRQQIAAIIDR